MREFVIVETIPVNCGRTKEAAMRFSAILAVDKGVPSEVLAYVHGHVCLADDGKAILFTPERVAELNVIDDTDDDSGCDCGENCDRSPGDPCPLDGEEERALHIAESRCHRLR